MDTSIISLKEKCIVTSTHCVKAYVLPAEI